MKQLIRTITLVLVFLALGTHHVFAATSSTITDYTNSTVSFITIIASSAVVFFLVKGGYLYITSSGKPESLENAKKTIKNALIGLVLVLGASVLVSLLTNTFHDATQTATQGAVQLNDIQLVKPSDGLTQVLLDAINGVMQNFVQSLTQPVVNSIMTFLGSTPDLLSNQVVMNFWLVSLGIVDSLFIVVVAVLGLHVMSAETFGFEQVELRQLLPRIGLAFLGANTSLFLCDYVIITCNALVKAVIDATGGLNQAWIVNIVTIQNFTSNQQGMDIAILFFLAIFLILAVVLLFMYVARLILISLAAVLSPFIFLLWTLPKFSDFAEIGIKSYIVTVFTIFVHIVVIQLAASFLALPEHSNNSIMAIAVAIGLFIVLLKIPEMLMKLVFYTTGIKAIGSLGGAIINILSGSKQQESRSDTKRDIQQGRENVAI